MSIWKKVSKTAMNTASSIGAKSSEMIEIGKLKMKRNQLEGKIEDKKTEIGNAVYHAYKDGNQPDKDTIMEMVNEIKSIEEEIAEISEKINAVHEKDGEEKSDSDEEDG